MHSLFVTQKYCSLKKRFNLHNFGFYVVCKANNKLKEVSLLVEKGIREGKTTFQTTEPV